jgi:hypothetical protein
VSHILNDFRSSEPAGKIKIWTGAIHWLPLSIQRYQTQYLIGHERELTMQLHKFGSIVSLCHVWLLAMSDKSSMTEFHLQDLAPTPSLGSSFIAGRRPLRPND